MIYDYVIKKKINNIIFFKYHPNNLINTFIKLLDALIVFCIENFCPLYFVYLLFLYKLFLNFILT